MTQEKSDLNKKQQKGNQMEYFKYINKRKTNIPDGAFVDGAFGSGRVVNGKIVIVSGPGERLKDHLGVFSQNGAPPNIPTTSYLKKNNERK